MDELTQHTMFFEPGMHVFHALVPAPVMFETPEGGGGGGGGEGGGEAGGATAVVDPAAGGEGAGAGAGDGFEYLGADDIAALVRENATTAFQEMLAEADRREQAVAQQRAAAAARAQENQPPEWDAFDPASVDRYIEWRAKQMMEPMQQQLAAASEFVQQGSIEAGKTQANEILDGFHKELGDFEHGPTILSAAAYMRQGIEPDRALAQAASEQAALEARIEARAFEKFKTAGQNLADAGHEPGTGGAAAEATQPLTRAGQRIDYKDAARGTLARMGAGRGVGDLN